MTAALEVLGLPILLMIATIIILGQWTNLSIILAMVVGGAVALFTAATIGLLRATRDDPDESGYDPDRS